MSERENLKISNFVQIRNPEIAVESIQAKKYPESKLIFIYFDI